MATKKGSKAGAPSTASTTTPKATMAPAATSGSKTSTKTRRKRSRSKLCANEFLEATKRARTLHDRVVVNGYAVKSRGATPTQLSKPDRWDIAEYVFFEVAAKFEQFVKRTLILEVEKTMRVGRSRAEHMVGSSDTGIHPGMGGWAHVKKMKARAKGLLGATSVYAKIDIHLQNPQAQYLQIAVTIRNRIAHGKGNDKFTEMLKKSPMELTADGCRGMTPGMLLAEYPKTAGAADKWFFRILDAYDRWAKIVLAKI